MSVHEEDYYIGLDIGTSSVGWAVTDSSYHILRAKGKDMWGARLFDEAQTAVARRSNRVSRRRHEREKQRISMLRGLLSNEINKVDPGFFHRLDESKYWIDDRTGDNASQKYAIFAKGSTGTEEYTDADYYRQYPTIFHLRSDLIHSDKPHDVRLLYLALLNMFKHRGHFLNESLGTESSSALDDIWNEFLNSFSLLSEVQSEDAAAPSINPFETVDRTKLIEILLQKGISKSQIREDAAKILNISRKDKREYSILSLVCGLAGNLEDIFGKETFSALEDKGKKSVNFRKGSFEEDFAEVQDFLDEESISLIMSIKEIHDVLLLDQIMQGHSFLCEARVSMYEEHKNDLELLKKTIKRLAPKEYSNFFRKMQDGNYSSYVGSTNCDKTGGKVRRYVADHATAKRNNEPDELYKTITKILTPFKGDEDVDNILSKITAETFLRKQLTSANGVIPNQVYVREMKAILEKAEVYIPSLKEKDSSGLTVSERILKLFMFHIPYYVGPVGGLNNNNGNKWAVRVSGEPITPWNISDVIDMGKTQQAFIENLIRHCTYLKGEKVLPKHSLLYEKFMVLNELNNLKIAGKPIDVALKQDIYNDLFMKGKQVTRRQLSDYLITRGKLSKGSESLIGGIEDRFNAYLSSVGKFNGVFEPPFLDLQHMLMIEDIILLGTIYGDSKKMFRKQIDIKYGPRSDAPVKLTDKQIKRISGFKFTDWGRCSRAFFETEGASKEDGVIRTIINALWETNDNLMQLLSPDKYTYTDNLSNLITRESKALSDWTIDDLYDMYLSAPVKRMVWQTLHVLSEIEEVMGHAPKRVFVEMTRENREKGVRTRSRKSQLLELYKNSEIKKEQRNWILELEGHTEQEFRIKKLYLYYCQMGRCMYTGEPIDLEWLMDDNLYDIDHIYPRHFVKDDSIENNLVLVKKAKNARKSDVYPLTPEIQSRCIGLWKDLQKKNLISKEKYDRLVRTTEFTLDERVGFVQRQLVETGQGTKAITQILKEALPESSNVVFSKAGVVSQFRHDFEIPKCRSINDFHHAQDAYLNIVVGNVYYTKFTKNPRNFIKEAMTRSGDDQYKYHLSKMFNYTVRCGSETSWICEKEGNHNTIDLVKRQIVKTTPLISRRSYIATGAITRKDTIYGKQKTSKADTGTYYPCKTSDKKLSDVTRYGGKSDIRTAAYTLLSYKEGKKVIRSIEPIPIFILREGNTNNINMTSLLNYLKEQITSANKKPCSDFQIVYPIIKLYSLIKVDGYYYYIGGCAGNRYYLYNAVPLKLPANEAWYIKKIDKAINNNDYYEHDENNNLIITKESNAALYNLILFKLNSGIYTNKKGPLLSSITKVKESFYDLDIQEQCKFLQILVSVFDIKTQSVDLSILGGVKNTGVMFLPKHINSLKECELINLSVTGLYENRINLLK